VASRLTVRYDRPRLISMSVSPGTRLVSYEIVASNHQLVRVADAVDGGAMRDTAGDCGRQPREKSPFNVKIDEGLPSLSHEPKRRQVLVRPYRPMASTDPSPAHAARLPA
jgi:hypothetical protein